MTATRRHGVPPPVASPVSTWTYARVCDCGDRSCGDLVLELREFLARLPVGERILVVARDPAAFIDVPAWCAVTGHVLLAQSHPYFLIQKAHA